MNTPACRYCLFAANIHLLKAFIFIDNLAKSASVKKDVKKLLKISIK
jgi:hypothetical protein